MDVDIRGLAKSTFIFKVLSWILQYILFKALFYVLGRTQCVSRLLTYHKTTWVTRSNQLRTKHFRVVRRGFCAAHISKFGLSFAGSLTRPKLSFSQTRS